MIIYFIRFYNNILGKWYIREVSFKRKKEYIGRNIV